MSTNLPVFTDSVLSFAPWSFSKVECLSTCPLQFAKRYVERVKETRASSESKVGNAVHGILENALVDSSLSIDNLLDQEKEKGGLTTEEFNTTRLFLPSIDDYLSWEKRFCEEARVVKAFTEYEMAIFTDFKVADYKDKTALIRGKVDRLLLTENNDLIVIDHKSGKHKPLDDHAAQLNVYRLFSVGLFPNVRSVQPMIHYVDNGKKDWDRPMSRETIERTLRPWLVHYLNKHDTRLTEILAGETKAKPGALCAKYCGYLDACPDGQAEASKRADKKKLQLLGI